MNGLDDTLIRPRTIMWSVPDAQGVGFDTKLECGHVVWMAVKPGLTQHCGQCLDQLIKQIRDIQAHQEPRR